MKNECTVYICYYTVYTYECTVYTVYECYLSKLYYIYIYICLPAGQFKHVVDPADGE